MEIRPRIGITMRLEIETRRFYLGRDYAEAVRQAGAVPLHIALIPDKDYVFAAAQDLDGILLPGSDTDVDPYFYGEDPHPKIKKTIAEKDETDFLLLAAAEELRIPVLAICFGMQALNVWRGGALYQDLEAQYENCLKHEQGVPLSRNSHRLKIKEASRLASLITNDDALQNVKVNSHHHQAIKSLGKDLRATAWANDGVIECIEDTRTDRYALGVQWHPELSYQFDDLSRAVFRDFVAHCAKKLGEKNCEGASTYQG